MKKLFLIDGHALIFRTYYAFLRRPMINSKGEDTSILYGFTKTLLELILKERPTHLAVAFDPPAKTFRHELYEAYKANRSETPELIKKALEPLITIVGALSIPVIMKEGFEADDVIGTIAKKASSKGFTVYMVTPDKDFGQLVSDAVFQYKPSKSGSEIEIIGKKEICEQYGITDPSQVIDILTIWGDASDNVPGVKGVGEIGSKKLINEYGSVENIYNKISNLSEKLQKSFIEAKDYIELSKKLVTIDTDVDVEFDEDKIRLETPHFEDLKKIFSHYEFNSLSKSLTQLEPIFNITGSFRVSENENKKRVVEHKNFKRCSLDDIIKESKANRYLSIKSHSNKILLSSGGFVTSIEDSHLGILSELFTDDSSSICGFDLKSLIHKLRERGISCNASLIDIELMHYVLAPERAHKADILMRSYLGIELEESGQVVQTSLFEDFTNESNQNEESGYLEVSHYWELAQILTTELKENSMWNLYYNIEMPLITVLADIEREGFKIDTQLLCEYSTQLKNELAVIESNIKQLAEDDTLNISSPKQLGVILYEKLNLGTKGKKGNGKNPSTDEETLNEIINDHPIVPLILEYRNIKKLITTYVDPLPTLINPSTGKIHTTFNQSLTATGRLSSIKPNLQNIPIRTERGREIRKAFIASSPEGLLLSADYSQIELRIMAHLSGDTDFIEAFNSGKDIHLATAAKIFKVTEDEVTKEQRNRAKTANFGIIYGISAYGLSQRLNITRSDSKKLIDDYFESYPQVREFMKRAVEKAGIDGYVQTIYGRKRYLPDIKSKNPVVRGLAERNAINAPIQGSAADIIKVAMVNIHKRLISQGLKSKMILQVHDELVFDTYPHEAAILSGIVREEMENVIKLSVPLTVECETGKNWLEAH